MTRPVRTRFAPSPTGHLHIGGARTALFSWAFARHHQGQFILRVEDTDVTRSTQENLEGIIASLRWLGLTYDEGPYYQMQRLSRYQEVIAQMLAAGTAYHCYTPPEELERLREQQRARGEKPRYDGRWRPEPGKTLPEPPVGVKPAVRFKNPPSGTVTWHDQVKGPIEFDNAELDDLIIARPDGTPTYNFCVVVDDWDMQITHVIRGDDHVNNTPRQINILKALGAELPQYAHLSMILGEDGQKLSKRHGAVSVMEYQSAGFLPQAIVNYLARLGWSHGDDEVFSREQLIEWFDLNHITSSAAQLSRQKLLWLNAHYIKSASPDELAQAVIALRGAPYDDDSQPPLAAICELYQPRAHTLHDLRTAADALYAAPPPEPADRDKYLDNAGCNALAAFAERCSHIEWTAAAINLLIKTIVSEQGIKMPQLAMPLRLAMTGSTQTPSVDALLALFTCEQVKARIACL